MVGVQSGAAAESRDSITRLNHETPWFGRVLPTTVVWVSFVGFAKGLAALN
jgi:hypothetical protein